MIGLRAPRLIIGADRETPDGRPDLYHGPKRPTPQTAPDHCPGPPTHLADRSHVARDDAPKAPRGLRGRVLDDPLQRTCSGHGCKGCGGDHPVAVRRVEVGDRIRTFGRKVAHWSIAPVRPIAKGDSEPCKNGVGDLEVVSADCGKNGATVGGGDDESRYPDCPANYGGVRREGLDPRGAKPRSGRGHAVSPLLPWWDRLVESTPCRGRVYHCDGGFIVGACRGPDGHPASLRVGCGHRDCEKCFHQVLTTRAGAAWERMQRGGAERVPWGVYVATLDPKHRGAFVGRNGARRLARLLWRTVAAWAIRANGLDGRWRLVGGLSWVHPVGDGPDEKDLENWTLAQDGREWHPHPNLLVPLVAARETPQGTRFRRLRFHVEEAALDELREEWRRRLAASLGVPRAEVSPQCHVSFKIDVKAKRHSLRYNGRPFPGWGERLNLRPIAFGDMSCRKWKRFAPTLLAYVEAHPSKYDLAKEEAEPEGEVECPQCGAPIVFESWSWSPVGSILGLTAAEPKPDPGGGQNADDG